MLRGGRLRVPEEFELTVNGETRRVSAERDTPLLYVLIDDLGLRGPKFGCGLAQCGACSVLVDGREVRACVYPAASAQGREVTTLEGLPAWHARHSGADVADPPLHPLQVALVEEQAPQCGYCYSGMIIKAAELLADNPAPSDAEIVAAMNGHLCRCGTYPRIVAAIRRAAEAMRA
jgi:aerobic-type carbon monoxide dehydrogenase small subunit (CoxS/CutS family)